MIPSSADEGQEDLADTEYNKNQRQRIHDFLEELSVLLSRGIHCFVREWGNGKIVVDISRFSGGTRSHEVNGLDSAHCQWLARYCEQAFKQVDIGSPYAFEWSSLEKQIKAMERQQ